MNQAAEVLNQGSITDRNDLEEFLATAELADSEFTAGKYLLHIYVPIVF